MEPNKADDESDLTLKIRNKRPLQKSASTQTPPPPKFILDRIRRGTTKYDESNKKNNSLRNVIVTGSQGINSDNLPMPLDLLDRQNDTPLSFDNEIPCLYTSGSSEVPYSMDDIDNSIAELSSTLISPKQYKLESKEVKGTPKLMQDKSKGTVAKIKAMMSHVDADHGQNTKNLIDVDNVFGTPASSKSSISEEFVFDDENWALDEIIVDSRPASRQAIFTSPDGAFRIFSSSSTGAPQDDIPTSEATAANSTPTTSNPVEQVEAVTSRKTGKGSARKSKNCIKITEEKVLKPVPVAVETKIPAKPVFVESTVHVSTTVPSHATGDLGSMSFDMDDWLGDFDLHHDFELHHLSSADWIVTHNLSHRNLSSSVMNDPIYCDILSAFIKRHVCRRCNRGSRAIPKDTVLRNVHSAMEILETRERNWFVEQFHKICQQAQCEYEEKASQQQDHGKISGTQEYAVSKCSGNSSGSGVTAGNGDDSSDGNINSNTDDTVLGQEDVSLEDNMRRTGEREVVSDHLLPEDIWQSEESFEALSMDGMVYVGSNVLKDSICLPEECILRHDAFTSALASQLSYSSELGDVIPGISTAVYPMPLIDGISNLSLMDTNYSDKDLQLGTFTDKDRFVAIDCWGKFYTDYCGPSELYPFEFYWSYASPVIGKSLASGMNAGSEGSGGSLSGSDQKYQHHQPAHRDSGRVEPTVPGNQEKILRVTSRAINSHWAGNEVKNDFKNGNDIYASGSDPHGRTQVQRFHSEVGISPLALPVSANSGPHHQSKKFKSLAYDNDNSLTDIFMSHVSRVPRHDVPSLLMSSLPQHEVDNSKSNMNRSPSKGSTTTRSPALERPVHLQRQLSTSNSSFMNHNMNMNIPNQSGNHYSNNIIPDNNSPGSSGYVPLQSSIQINMEHGGPRKTTNDVKYIKPSQNLHQTNVMMEPVNERTTTSKRGRPKGSVKAANRPQANIPNNHPPLHRMPDMTHAGRSQQESHRYPTFHQQQQYRPPQHPHQNNHYHKPENSYQHEIGDLYDQSPDRSAEGLGGPRAIQNPTYDRDVDHRSHDYYPMDSQGQVEGMSHRGYVSSGKALDPHMHSRQLSPTSASHYNPSQSYTPPTMSIEDMRYQQMRSQMRNEKDSTIDSSLPSSQPSNLKSTLHATRSMHSNESTQQYRNEYSSNNEAEWDARNHRQSDNQGDQQQL